MSVPKAGFIMMAAGYITLMMHRLRRSVQQYIAIGQWVVVVVAVVHAIGTN
jgi:hypothetical protein